MGLLDSTGSTFMQGHPENDPEVERMRQAMISGKTISEIKESENSPLIVDSGDKEIDELASRLGLQLNDSTKDYLMEYFLNEKASQNAFGREMYASNTQYQRAVEDLRKAGINPFLAFDSLRGSSPSSSSSGVSGGHYTNRANNNVSNGVKAGVGIGAILATIAAAIMKIVGGSMS